MSAETHTGQDAENVSFVCQSTHDYLFTHFIHSNDNKTKWHYYLFIIFATINTLILKKQKQKTIIIIASFHMQKLK